MFCILSFFCRFPTANKQQRGTKSGEKPRQLYTNKVKRLGGAIGGGGVIIDARNKIVQKNRSKIRDARDKLAQIAKRSGDARHKLNSKRKQSADKYSLKNSQGVQLPRQSSYDRRRMPPPAYDHMDMDEEYMPPGIALRRTVQNEIAYTNMPPLPTFQRSVPSYHPHQVLLMRSRSPPPPQSVSASLWNSDPFDCYEVPIGRPADVSEPKNLQRHIRNVGADILPRKGILRSTRERVSPSPVGGGYAIEDNSHLSYEMRARLERPPDSNVSMGIFSNPYTAKLPAAPSKALHGYRIVVSNLHCSVSQSDIKELFEDIGELVEARLVRPGVAEVIFSTMKDAEAAVDSYHNRQLDGQPMKCLLVNPRASSKPTAPAIKSRR